MPTNSCPRSYHHRHLDFAFAAGETAGTRRLTVHSAEVLRSLLSGDTGGGAAASGYKNLGSVELPAAIADALQLVLGDLRTDLSPKADIALTAAPEQRQRHEDMAQRLEAFFTRNRGNPLVANGVVVDPRSVRGRQLVAQIKAGQAEPRLLADWVRLRIEWRQILETS